MKVLCVRGHIDVILSIWFCFDFVQVCVGQNEELLSVKLQSPHLLISGGLGEVATTFSSLMSRRDIRPAFGLGGPDMV